MANVKVGDKFIVTSRWEGLAQGTKFVVINEENSFLYGSTWEISIIDSTKILRVEHKYFNDGVVKI